MSTSSSKPFSLPLLFLVLLLTAGVRSDDASDLCPRVSDGPSCPINCFRPDPVCGADGVTYWCGCIEAACAGVAVAKLGFCQVGSGGTGLVSGQAFLLVHIVWLILLGFSVLCGFL
ncbi:serine-type endopeptidase inhibitor precursor [Iris pallida]|uniref:Serine-type endopeptidase inhibitor n=1 Tax=Iris pallida TaxID=29817 RepID=A0AAX6IEB7_IRIPA|nr:serine-type endopeptidase inhibitor precursor [Iris pallida]KAJ6851680.1 serine-type endopeptidase inhibitor precursor [Iris pallida]